MKKVEKKFKKTKSVSRSSRVKTQYQKERDERKAQKYKPRFIDYSED